jgi:hypothetical protein
MEFKREYYINKLINKQNNGMIKVVTGIRRCGKSYLLNTLFVKYLKKQGIDDSHIIKIDFDSPRNEKYHDALTLFDYLESLIKDNKTYYFLLDEIQLVNKFESVLNGLLRKENADIYVTGSNSKFLSSDVITEFRGRGDEIRVYPLSFAEFLPSFNGEKAEALTEYMIYGGMPMLQKYKTSQEKNRYLQTLFNTVYLKDIKNRYNINNDGNFEELLNIISSYIGSLTNPTKLENTFKTVKNVNVNHSTIKLYLDYLKDAFLIDSAYRYDIKGKKYIDTPLKYYFTDIGLRNARIDFRQTEPEHIMENIIFNELKKREYNVDVGIVEIFTKNKKGKREKKQLEVDFVVNEGSRRYYIQTALSIPNKEKMDQEQKSLVNIPDSFKKIIVVRDYVQSWQNEEGVTIVSIYDFLLKDNILEIC